MRHARGSTPSPAMNLPKARSGVLASQHLATAIDDGFIHGGGRWVVPKENIQPASLDLRLGETAYRLQCSFLPGSEKVMDKMKTLFMDEIDLRKHDGAVLESGRPYLIPLKEQIALPDNVRGRANPKSSTGRLDIFTRVITDGGSNFDDIRPGYVGGLYLEVVPLSFPVRVREDLALNQLRLSVGNPRLTENQVRDVHKRSPLLYEKDGRPIRPKDLAFSDGLFLSLDLEGDQTRQVGYRARETPPLVDLTGDQLLNPTPFWESVSGGGDRIILTPESFYLLMSEEAVSIPPWLASEMTAYDPTSGELRTHYAGFFDPGFGYSSEGTLPGSRAALEVRAHNVPFLIEHRQRVCKLTFERMLEEPERLYGQSGSSYQGQSGPLGKHFERDFQAPLFVPPPPVGPEPDRLPLNGV